MKKVMLNLASDIEKLNANNAHATFQNIQHTNGLTGVISVYNNVKPSHIVLDELYEWAEKECPVTAQKIKDLELDMSWNKSEL